MKHNGELSSFPAANKLLKFAIIALIACLGLLCLYYGCSFGPGSRRSDEEASGSDGLHPLLGGFVLHRDLDHLHDDQEHNSEILKSLPVCNTICDLQFSELIPCLERNLIYQPRLKPNLTFREHHERRCPAPERRYNCLIPPPLGYKIPIRWPESRDEVWKANIPHTHLAHVKSDQNWMVVNGDKISFPGGGTHFHEGAGKYIVALYRVLKH